MKKEIIATFSFDAESPHLHDTFNPDDFLSREALLCDGRLLPATTNRIRFLDLFNNLTYDERYGVSKNNVAGVLFYYASLWFSAITTDESIDEPNSDYFVAKLNNWDTSGESPIWEIIDREYDYLIGTTYTGILSYIYGCTLEDLNSEDTFMSFVSDVTVALMKWLSDVVYELLLFGDLILNNPLTAQDISAHVDSTGFIVVDIHNRESFYSRRGKVDFKQKILDYIEENYHA